MASEITTVEHLDAIPDPVALTARDAAKFHNIPEHVVYGRCSQATLPWLRFRASYGDASRTSGRRLILLGDLELLAPNLQGYPTLTGLNTIDEVMADRKVADPRYVGALLGLNPETIKVAARRGFMPGEKFGQRWLFEREALRDWFRRNRIPARWEVQSD